MPQNLMSPAAVARRKTSRAGERALFAARINRAIKVDFDQDVVIVTPGQDLETLRYQQVHLEVGRINDLLRHGGFRNLLVDLRELRCLESVVLTALVGFCRSIPGKAAFCSVADDIRQSMETAKLGNLWPIHDNRSEALHALTESSPPT